MKTSNEEIQSARNELHSFRGELETIKNELKAFKNTPTEIKDPERVEAVPLPTEIKIISTPGEIPETRSSGETFMTIGDVKDNPVPITSESLPSEEKRESKIEDMKGTDRSLSERIVMVERKDEEKVISQVSMVGFDMPVQETSSAYISGGWNIEISDSLYAGDVAMQIQSYDTMPIKDMIAGLRTMNFMPIYEQIPSVAEIDKLFAHFFLGDGYDTIKGISITFSVTERQFLTGYLNHYPRYISLGNAAFFTHLARNEKRDKAARYLPSGKRAVTTMYRISGILGTFSKLHGNISFSLLNGVLKIS